MTPISPLEAYVSLFTHPQSTIVWDHTHISIQTSQPIFAVYFNGLGTLVAGSHDDRVAAQRLDSAFMSGGDDELLVYEAAGHVDLGDGDDLFLTPASVETVFAGDGDDTVQLYRDEHADSYLAGPTVAGHVDLGSGDDALLSNMRIGSIDAGAGADHLVLTDAALIDAGAGADTVEAETVGTALLGDGDDTLTLEEGGKAFGGDGDDHFFAGTGENELFGGRGRDVFDHTAVLSGDDAGSPGRGGLPGPFTGGRRDAPDVFDGGEGWDVLRLSLDAEGPDADEAEFLEELAEFEATDGTFFFGTIGVEVTDVEEIVVEAAGGEIFTALGAGAGHDDLGLFMA